MANRRGNSSPPATTPQSREDQLISMAYDLAEERLRTGKATGAEIVQLLKWGSSKERLKKDILEKQKELVSAKTEALQSAKRVEELYEDAMKAMTSYAGGGSGE